MERSGASGARRSDSGWARSRPAVLAGLALVLFAGLAIRLRNFPAGGRYSDIGTGYYAADSAMRYRYARMIAEGDEIPAVDRSIQYPEGLRVREVLFLLPDRITGDGFRVAHAVYSALGFDAWLRALICVLGVLAAIPVYLLACGVWRSAPAGLAGAAIYLTAMPSFGRSTGSYLREEFVLPLLLWGVFFFLRSWWDGRWVTRILSGACFLAALSMWHLTPFFLLVFIPIPMIRALATSDRRLARSLMVLTLFAAMAGGVAEPLRARHWIVSPVMLLLFAFCAAWAAPGCAGRGRRGNVARAALFAAAASGFFLLFFSRGSGAYGHVFSLLLAKVRFLGRIPADPTRVSFDVRALWTGPFDGPGWRTAGIAFALPLLLALHPGARLFASIAGGKKGDGGSEGGAGEIDPFDRLLILGLALLFLPLYALVTRLEIFLIAFVAVVAGGSVRGPRSLRLALPVVLIFMGLEAWHYAEGTREAAWWGRLLPAESHKPRTPRDADVSVVFQRIEELTEPDAVILARYPLSPMILAYTGRRVVVHPIFESLENRRKIETITTAAFGDARAYHALCLDLGVQYVLYEANTLFDTSPGFDRYMAAARVVDPGSAVYRMHFFPGRLEGFRLVGQTRYFRLFRVEPGTDGGGGEAPGVGGAGPGGYSAQFDPDLFGASPGRVPDDARLRAALGRIADGLEAYNRAYFEYRAGRYEEAARTLNPVLRAMPRLEDARRLALQALIQAGNGWYRAGRFDRAAAACAEAAAIAPDAALPRLLAGACRAAQGRFPEAEAEFLAAVSLDPENAEAHEKLGMAYIETGDLAAARRQLERALELDPAQPRVRRLLDSLP